MVIHEKVHLFLAPKVDILRSYHASARASSYMRSSLYRYIEEAMAETIAQVGVSGFRQFFTGVKSPVRKGYMYIRRGGGYSPQFKGHGLIPEGAALLYTGLAAGFRDRDLLLRRRPLTSKALALRKILDWLKQRSSAGPTGPTPRLTATEAIDLAKTAAAQEPLGPSLSLATLLNRSERLVWSVSAPVMGRGLEVEIDDESGHVLALHHRGVR